MLRLDSRRVYFAIYTTTTSHPKKCQSKPVDLYSVFRQKRPPKMLSTLCRMSNVSIIVLLSRCSERNVTIPSLRVYCS